MQTCQEDFTKNNINNFFSIFTKYGSQEAAVEDITKDCNKKFLNSVLPCGVSPLFKKSDKNALVGGGQKHITSSGLLSIYKSAACKGLTDEVRKKMLIYLNQKRSWIFTKFEDGRQGVMESMMRGNQRYTKLYRHKIIETCLNYQQSGMEIFALTITWDSKREHGNHLSAWAKYNTRKGRLMKELKRHFGAKYVSVLESTKKGYPHAHILLALPKGTFIGYSKLRNKAKIKYGKLYHLIRKFAPAPVFHLEAIKGRNTPFYLVKYMTKNETTDIFSLRKKKEDYTADERKMIDCLLFCIMTEIRQFSMTQERRRKSADRVSEEEKTPDNKTQSEKGTGSSSPAPCPNPPENSATKLRFLITLCNNLPAHCKYRMLFMGANRYNLLFGDKDPHEIEQNYEELQKFKKGAAELGCGGCIFSELFNFLFGKDSFLINPYFWNGDNELVRLFDDCDFTDDNELVKYIRHAIAIYFDSLKYKRFTTDAYIGQSATIGQNIYRGWENEMFLEIAYRRHLKSKEYDKLLKKVQELS